MGYNKDNYRRIRDEYGVKSALARKRAEQRMSELREKFHELDEIDRALSLTGIKIMRAAAEGKDGLEERISALKSETEALRSAREEFLSLHGYPCDYTDVKYECANCSDTGYTERGMCKCMRKALILAGDESSGIASLIKKQSFENFKLDYYNKSQSSRDNMRHVFSILRRYADNFTTGKAENLLLLGGTGLGKTHLSTSLAKVIIDRGYDVVYESAQNIFSDFEHDRFKSGYNDDPSDRRGPKYLECELLIIDDLGVEISNQFTLSCLYNIINTRLNLTQNELRSRYADRITSRLLGEYRLLLFMGEDIRAQKLREQTK